MLTWLKKIWKAYRRGAVDNDFPVIASCGFFGGKLRHPSTLNEALYAIDKLDEVYRNNIFGFNQSEIDVVVKFHHTFGRWIRNNWGLWDKNSSSHQWFKERGIWHADDMSGIIIRSYYRSRVKSQPIRFQEQVQHYIEYWAAETDGRGVIMWSE